MKPERQKGRRDREHGEDDTPTILPLPSFTHRSPVVGSQVWVVQLRREKAALCEIKQINRTDGTFVVFLGRENRKPIRLDLPLNRLGQVGEYLYRITTD